MGQEDEFSVRELSLLRRRVRAAIATARRRWALPIREIEEGVFFVDLACDADEPDSSASSGILRELERHGSRRWGGARVVRARPVSRPAPHPAAACPSISQSTDASGQRAAAHHLSATRARRICHVRSCIRSRPHLSGDHFDAILLVYDADQRVSLAPLG